MNSKSDWCFPADSVRFLNDLSKNNNRDWFAQHKSVYEQSVKRPARDYCALMCEELNTLTDMPHRSKIFRVHRDLRFSKDKSPYNAHLHILFTPEQNSGASPGWFFALEPQKVIFGMGTFAFDKPALERFRQHVVDSQGALLAQHLKQLRANGVRISDPELKRAPRGYQADQEFSPLLQHKGLTAWRDLQGTDLAIGPGLIDRSVEEYRTLMPLFGWLGAL